MIGPGKYDYACTVVRHLTRADGVLLIVLNGEAGNGFSAQLPLPLNSKLPEILRHMANQIERDAARIKESP